MISQYSTTGRRTAAKARYNAKHYDQLKIWTPKGGRVIISQMAAAAGLSVAEYIRTLIIKDADSKGIDIRSALGGGGVTSTTAAKLLALQLVGDWIP